MADSPGHAARRRARIEALIAHCSIVEFGPSIATEGTRSKGIVSNRAPSRSRAGFWVVVVTVRLRLDVALGDSIQNHGDPLETERGHRLLDQAVARADLKNVRWVSNRRDLVQLPAAA